MGRGQVGQIPVTFAELKELREVLLKSGELGAGFRFGRAPLLRVARGAIQGSVALRPVGVGERTSQFGINVLDGLPRTFATDEAADLGFDCRVQRRGRGRTRQDLARERGTMLLVLPTARQMRHHPQLCRCPD
jgi:hypothetical protein